MQQANMRPPHTVVDQIRGPFMRPAVVLSTPDQRPRQEMRQRAPVQAQRQGFSTMQGQKPYMVRQGKILRSSVAKKAMI
jgi:hypothetical protein